MLGMVVQLQRLQQVHRLVDHVLALAGRLQHRGGGAEPLGHCDIDVLQHRQPAEQPIDLEGAGDAELDALGLRDRGDVAAVEQHAAGRRRQHAGEQIDERGLAGAVGTDQRVAGAALEPEVDVARGGERAEIFAQAAGLEQRRGHGWPRFTPNRRRGHVENAENAVAREQRDHHEQEAEPELPGGRIELARGSATAACRRRRRRRRRRAGHSRPGSA